MKAPLSLFASCVVAAVGSFGCSGELNAGYDRPHGELPVDERSAMVVVNDGSLDNWQGEYAALLAASGRLRWVGLVVNTNAEYPTLATNAAGFRRMLSAARESGMRHLPEPTASAAPTLAPPTSGVVEDTVPNDSEGARLIVQAVKDFGTVAHPLAVATGGALTDVADAWLLDPSIADRLVVVASLGRTSDSGDGASTADPNGARDTWATYIAMSRLRFVQVSGYYDQQADVPEDRLAELPSNAFGAWMAEKRSTILGLIQACDQIAVLSAALPWFAREVTRMRLSAADPTLLEAAPDGPLWHVPTTDSEGARRELWQMLLEPSTYE